MEGKITTSTFVLDQPRCVFNNVVKEDDDIWLVVAYSSEVDKFKPPRLPLELPFQELKKNSFYMTLSTVEGNYPCPEEDSNNLNVLRVGSETSCTWDLSRPDCNGPLPDPGPYRVKFVVMNNQGNTTETKWSEPITLIQGKSPDSIDTSPVRRRTGVTIIASILSILFAILLAAFIATLCYKYSDICSGADMVSGRDPTITHYTTHHRYDQPAASRSEPHVFG
ncbi:uroplakin-3b isoform X2 [Rhineura floridana]|nr:uroplakin-3b isoform X2 [Rhineura floridana]